jgi:hypothetical protein
MNLLLSILLCFLVLLPYAAVFYKRESIRVRLLLATIGEVLLVAVAAIVSLWLNTDSALIFVHSFSLVGGATILLNLLFLVVFWI